MVDFFDFFLGKQIVQKDELDSLQGSFFGSTPVVMFIVDPPIK